MQTTVLRCSIILWLSSFYLYATPLLLSVATTYYQEYCFVINQKQVDGGGVSRIGWCVSEWLSAN